MSDRRVQRCHVAIRLNDRSMAREGPGTEVLSALGSGAGRSLAEISLQQFSSSLLLPACNPVHPLSGHPSHFAEVRDPRLHVDDKSNAKN